jgi:cardiolipin synthase
MAEYQPTMYHVKALIVDSLLVSVGSTNFDNRSFSLNDEANLNVLDPAFARAQEAVFDDDWRHARQVTLARWEGRPWQEKLGGELAHLIGAQL